MYFPALGEIPKHYFSRYWLFASCLAYSLKIRESCLKNVPYIYRTHFDATIPFYLERFFELNATMVAVLSINFVLGSVDVLDRNDGE